MQCPGDLVLAHSLYLIAGHQPHGITACSVLDHSIPPGCNTRSFPCLSIAYKQERIHAKFGMEPTQRDLSDIMVF